LQFKPKETFHIINENGDIVTSYVEGLLYSIRNDVLARAVAKWHAEGKVEILDTAATVTRGTAKVE
jgi:hypothetical protein